MCNLTPAVWKKRRSVGRRDEREGEGREERVIARSLTTQQWSLSHAQIRYTQIDRESCSAGGRYSPSLFPCLLVYKRWCTSKSHISMLRPHERSRLLVRPVMSKRNLLYINNGHQIDCHSHGLPSDRRWSISAYPVQSTFTQIGPRSVSELESVLTLLGYISTTLVHLAQCWSCLRFGKATLLEPYGVFTIARHYADRLSAVTALSWRRDNAVATLSRHKLDRRISMASPNRQVLQGHRSPSAAVSKTRNNCIISKKS